MGNVLHTITYKYRSHAFVNDKFDVSDWSVSKDYYDFGVPDMLSRYVKYTKTKEISNIVIY